jgi:hypothetical protein
MPVIGYLVGCWIGKSAGFESRPFAELKTKRYDMRAMMVRYGRVLGNSNHDPLDLIEADLIPPAIIELRRARRSVVRHRRGPFERAAVLEVGRESDRLRGTHRHGSSHEALSSGASSG